MARGGCGWLLIALGATVVGFWAGCQGLFTAATNFSPTQMTCAEYVAERPDSAWLELTECEADYIDTVYQEKSYSTDIEKIWVPVFPAGSSPDARTPLVLESEDPEIISFIGDTFSSVESAGADELGLLQALLAFEQNKTLDIDGLVLYGFELDDDEHAKVAGLSDKVDQDFVIVRHHQSPSLMGAFGWLGLGVLGLLGLGIIVTGFVGGDEE